MSQAQVDLCHFPDRQMIYFFAPFLLKSRSSPQCPGTGCMGGYDQEGHIEHMKIMEQRSTCSIGKHWERGGGVAGGSGDGGGKKGLGAAANACHRAIGGRDAVSTVTETVASSVDCRRTPPLAGLQTSCSEPQPNQFFYVPPTEQPSIYVPYRKQ